MSQQTHSTKYTSRLYLHSSHVVVDSSSGVSRPFFDNLLHPLATVCFGSDWPPLMKCLDLSQQKMPQQFPSLLFYFL